MFIAKQLEKAMSDIEKLKDKKENLLMERITKKVIKYTQQKWEDNKAMNMFKMLRTEVDINGTGTHKYRLKEGKNKGKWYYDCRRCCCSLYVCIR